MQPAALTNDTIPTRPAPALVGFPASASGMDVRRPGVRRRVLLRRGLLVAGLVALAAAAALGLSRLEPAAPLVDASSVWMDSVRRGEMLRQVRGSGSLVAEQILFIAAVTEGRVESILVHPGSPVEAGAILVQLSSPELEQLTLDAEYAVKMGQARLRDLSVTLESQTLTQRGELARLATEVTQARLNFELKQAMFNEGLERPLPYKIAKANHEDLEKRFEVEQERLRIRRDSVEAQLALQGADVEKLQALARLRQSQLEALKVRAPAAGVLQELPGLTANAQLQVGQRVQAGTVLAKLVQPGKLKAQLRIPETQIKDVRVGMPVQVDTRIGNVPGQVARIDPAAKDGTVTVDVQLNGPLPPGVRPDLSVDGLIESERLPNVLYVARPAFAQASSTSTLFRCDPSGKLATRVPVRFGRLSANSIEVLDGLKEGDRVVLSDMSAWEGNNRIRLN